MVVTLSDVVVTQETVMGDTTGKCSVVTILTVVVVTHTHCGSGDTRRCSGDT